MWFHLYKFEKHNNKICCLEIVRFLGKTKNIKFRTVIPTVAERKRWNHRGQRAVPKHKIHVFFSFVLFIYYFTILYWFCHTLTWIHHGCIWVPHPEPPSHLPPHPIPLGHPSAPAPSTLYHASNLDWRFISHMIIYMFHVILPYHPALTLSLRVQKTVLYICVSFAVSHTGLSLPSF